MSKHCATEQQLADGIYIGRGSLLGNPFTHKEGTKAQFIVASREEAVAKYKEWLIEQLQVSAEIQDAYEALLSKYRQNGELILICYCKPAACHGDVLKEMLEQEIKMTEEQIICVISGMQSGSDIGGTKAAAALGVPTTGCMPRGFITETGKCPEYAKLYNAYEHSSDKYSPRTWENVVKSDGTLLIVTNPDSAGTKTTLKAIHQYNKPYFIVVVKDTLFKSVSKEHHPFKAAEWIKANNIHTLNIAGNRESVSHGIEKWAEYYVGKLLELVNSNDGTAS